MISVAIDGPHPPSCAECGQRLEALRFAVPLPTYRGDERRRRGNLALPCGCVMNVEDVTNGEPSAPDRARLAARRDRVPGGRRAVHL